MVSLTPKNWVRGSPVGSGSFGVVHLAMSRTTGELFVVKSARTSTELASLATEAAILESLNSPYIVRCLGHEIIGKQGNEQEFNLFMEYMAGGSLSEIIGKFGGALDETVVRSYTREILKGIEYLHRNGIVHCDVKCKNVLIGSSGNIKLADLGCAKRLRFDHRTQPVCGTPLWMAPEVLKNGMFGCPSDVWSLGCTVIEMATGRPPWADDGIKTPAAAVYKIACSGDLPKFPDNLSEEGKDFLSKCLIRDPKERWTCQELLHHPFINERLQEECSKERASSSPTSMFGIGLRLNWSSEELESPKRWRREEKLRRKQSGKFDFQATGGWIEVRSG